MDFTRIVTGSLPAQLKVDAKVAFAKVVDIYRERCHTVNRRLSGVVLLEEWDPKCEEIIAVTNTSPKNVEVNKFIPKSSDVFSTCAYEISVWLDDHTVEFRPCVLDEKRHPHVSFPYRFVLEESRKQQWNLSLYVANNRNDSIWLQKVAFPRLLRWFGEVDEQHSILTSHKLISAEDYAQLYREIKDRWGQQIVADWTERTNPQKFVFEDCAIAAYLIAYWRQNNFLPRRFCDIGCGNGLLVHLLQQMKVNGYGIDLRQRKIWLKFAGTDLKERVLNPEKDSVDDADFLIGNHADELTPWIPIMAARLGYHVKEDRLKIPSTKRCCFLCTVPDSGLVDNVEEVISNMLMFSNVKNFVPREKVEKVRNCSQLPWEFRQMLTMKVFKHLFSISPSESTSWRRGGTCPLNQIADLLDDDEKTKLRHSDGGLQTFLKNQHQIFKVVRGAVSIRDWSTEGRRKVEGKLKTSDCWFHNNHPDGCPLQAQHCSYKH